MCGYHPKRVIVAHDVCRSGGGDRPRNGFKGTNIKHFDEFEYFASQTGTLRNAFENCASLASVVIPQIVHVLGPSVFKGTSKLQNITLYERIVYIEGGCFKGSGVRTVHAYCNPPSNQIFSDTFDTVSNGTIYVSAEFAPDSVWEMFASKGWTISYTL